AFGRDLEIALAQIGESVGKVSCLAGRQVGIGTVEADNMLIERQLIAAPVAEGFVIVLGDEQAVDAHTASDDCEDREERRSAILGAAFRILKKILAAPIAFLEIRSRRISN